MTTLGDKMSDEEVEEILLFAKTEDGEYIKYAG
jgi:Ca2+-binding EF-hand superfamily protein